MSPEPLIWINAYPGTGKKTIAESLTSLLGHERAILIHNHMLIDPVAKKYTRSDPEWLPLRRKIREEYFAKYVESVGWSGHIVIFTDYKANKEEARSVACEYKDVAERSGRPFLPVYLSINFDENMERGTSEERVNGGTTKPVTVERLTEIRTGAEPYIFPDVEGIHLDVTNMSAKEAALTISKRLDVWHARAKSTGDENRVSHSVNVL